MADIEASFRACVAEIQAKVDKAARAMAKAHSLAEEYGIPFDKIDLPTQVGPNYLDETEWGSVSEALVGELTRECWEASDG